jgi:hypothetical protein
MAGSIALTGRGGLAPTPIEIDQTHCENEGRADASEPRRRPSIRLKESGRDNVLDLRRAGQRIHSEGKGAERDRSWNQSLRDLRLPEHFGGERINGEDHNEKRDAAVSEQAANQNDRQHSPLTPDQTDHRRDDRFGKAGEFDDFSENRAEQKDREIKFHEADHFIHEKAGEDRRHSGGIGQQDGEQSGDRCKEYDTEAAICDEH